MERLIEILNTMAIPHGRLDLTKDENIQWLGRNIWMANDNHPDIQEALRLLKANGARLVIGLKSEELLFTESKPLGEKKWTTQTHLWSGKWTDPEPSGGPEIMSITGNLHKSIISMEVIFDSGERKLYTRVKEES